MRNSVVIAACIVITSCASAPRDIPVRFDCPAIVLPADPDAPIDRLTERSEPDEVMKAWVATTAGYRDWNHAVRRQNQSSYGESR